MTSFRATKKPPMIALALLQNCLLYCKADTALLQTTPCSIAKPMPLYCKVRNHRTCGFCICNRAIMVVFWSNRFLLFVKYIEELNPLSEDTAERAEVLSILENFLIQGERCLIELASPSQKAEERALRCLFACDDKTLPL